MLVWKTWDLTLQASIIRNRMFSRWFVLLIGNVRHTPTPAHTRVVRLHSENANESWLCLSLSLSRINVVVSNEVKDFWKVVPRWVQMGSTTFHYWLLNRSRWRAQRCFRLHNGFCRFSREPWLLAKHFFPHPGLHWIYNLEESSLSLCPGASSPRTWHGFPWSVATGPLLCGVSSIWLDRYDHEILKTSRLKVHRVDKYFHFLMVFSSHMKCFRELQNTLLDRSLPFQGAPLSNFQIAICMISNSAS